MKKLLCSLFILLGAISVRSQEVPGTGLFPGALDTTGSLFNTKNNAVSTLNGSITNASGSLTVVTGSKFPASSFSITIDSEIIYCTTRTGNVITGLTRGAAGTVAASHTSGVSVRAPVLAEHHNILASQLVATQTKLGYTPGGSVNVPVLNSVMAGVGTGQSGWTGAPTILRVIFATGGEQPPSLTDYTAGSRVILYNGVAPDHLAYGVESGALWTNVATTNSLKWYFAAVLKHTMTRDGISLGNGTALNASAILQLDSTTRGFLPPRMTTAERDAIGVVEGLFIYNLTTKQINFHNGTAWTVP